jgi:hypothetical protein
MDSDLLFEDFWLIGSKAGLTKLQFKRPFTCQLPRRASIKVEISNIFSFAIEKMNSTQDIGNVAKKKIFTFPGGRMALSALLIVGQMCFNSGSTPGADARGRDSHGPATWMIHKSEG